MSSINSLLPGPTVPVPERRPRLASPPRQGFFEHAEYLAVRAHLTAPWQDILDLAYYSGWRKNEILGLTWDEIDEAGGVIRLSPARSKTLVGRILPISQPIAEALARRRARRDPDSPLVFHRDGIPIRRWRTAWRTACQAAGVPTRFLHDCRRRRRPHPDPRQRARAGRHTPDRAQKPGDLRPRHHHPRTGTARRRRPARRLSGAADAGSARAGGRRWPDTARLCAAARAQATRTGRPAIAAHVATWRADAAKHGHPPDGSLSATRGRGAQGVPLPPPADLRESTAAMIGQPPEGEDRAYDLRCHRSRPSCRWRRTTMSRSAARESRQRQRLCETCRQRKARYRFRGRVRADRQHTLCFACFRSLRDRHHAQSRVDHAALRSPFRPPLTPRQIAHRRTMLVHLETLNTTAPPRQGTLRCE